MKKFIHITLAFLLISSILGVIYFQLSNINSNRNIGKTQGVTTQNITPPKTTDYQTNPGMGWQYMPSSNTSFFPETTSYIGRSSIAWRFVNPNDGVFDWSIIDNEIANAQAQGKQTSFRIYSMRGEGFGGSEGGDQLPDYVRDQNNVLIGGSTRPNGRPNYNSCIYQQEWSEFVTQIRNRYDGNQSIAYIDISGYSEFNEWSYYEYTTFEGGGLQNPTTLDGFARKRLVDIFLGGSSSSHQCEDASGNTVTISYNHNGFQQTQLIMPFAGDRMSLAYALGKLDSVGARNDCLGANFADWNDMNPQVQDLFSTRWETAPIIYEICPSGWTLERSMRTLRHSHGSMVHDNPSGSAAYNNRSTVESMMNDVGYKFQLQNAESPILVSNQREVPITLNWQNLGFSPAYERMGQDFEQRVIIKNSSNEEIVNATMNLTNGQDPNNWMPAPDLFNPTPPTYTTIAELSLPIDTPGGDYTIFIGVYDQRLNEFINLYNTTNNENLIELTTFTYSTDGSNGGTSSSDSGGSSSGSEEEGGSEPESITFSPVYRFWSQANQSHFYTVSVEERDLILSNYPEFVWKLEGIAFNAVNCSVTGSRPVYRFWSIANQTHFYTASTVERDLVINNYPNNIWNYEGIAYCHGSNLSYTGRKPVYRFWSPDNETHFYTSNATERDMVINDYPDNIWRYEGIAFSVR